MELNIFLKREIVEDISAFYPKEDLSSIINSVIFLMNKKEKINWSKMEEETSKKEGIGIFSIFVEKKKELLELKEKASRDLGTDFIETGLVLNMALLAAKKSFLNENIA